MWKLIKYISSNSVNLSYKLPRKIYRCQSTVPLQATYSPNVLKEGTELEGFIVQDTQHIPEFQMTALKFEHLKTKAEYYHLSRDDPNNVFAIAFRTPPPDSTGITHILEHLSLCGSSKFPCRDPFFKMINRSLATFLNAMTGPDYTFYPFSSQNHQDYFNLMSIYLDAVFNPQLKHLDFMQEGWRLEHEDIHDKNSPIIFKGVVFNEMKGAFSDNSYIFAEAMMNNILPINCYQHVSGGDPMHILNLKYENLVKYHRQHYHPTNSKFFSYGNFNVEHHLAFLNNNYLTNVKPSELHRSQTTISSVPSWSTPKRIHVDGRFDPLASSDQSHIAVSYKCTDIKNFEEIFVLSILGDLLLKGPNAKFYKNLIETGLGLSFSPVTGYESSIQDTLFTIGLQGVNSDKFDEIIGVIEKTIDEVIEEGFSQKQVDSVLHSLELSLKHQSSNFGLNLLFWLVPIMNHDADVLRLLHVNDRLAWFRKHIQDNPKFLQNKVRQYLKNNPHKLVITMSPEKTFDDKLKEIEDKILNERLGKLNENELNKIYDTGIELRKEQEQPQDVDCLPTLKLSDVDDKLDNVDTKDIKIANVPTQVAVQPTNGMTYFRAVIETADMSSELKPHVPLFNYVVNQMRTNNYDFREMDQLIQMSTGGITFSSHFAESCQSPHAFEEGVLVSSYCLEENNNKMFEVLSELFNNVQLTDLDRFTTLVNTLSSELINGISHSGHKYAMSLASSLIDAVSQQKELYSGISFVSNIKKISQTKNFDVILKNIQTIGDHVLTKDSIRCSLNVSPQSSATQHLQHFLENTKGSYRNQKGHLSHDFQPDIQKVCHVLPFPIHFTAKSIAGVPFLHPDYVALKVLAKLLTSKYLLPEVREKNGAYGAGAVISPSGTIQFYSYRDPYSLETLDRFDKSDAFLSDFKITQQIIDESKLGVFQEVDAPVPPGSKGMNKFLYGKTDDMIEKFRLDVKKVSEEDVRRVAETYLKPCARQSSYAIIGPKNNSLGEGWTEVVHE